MIKISKPIKELLELFGLNKRKMPNNLLKNLECVKDAVVFDFEYTLTNGEQTYINYSLEPISIKDIVGTTSKSRNITLLEYMSELYTDKNEYGKRSLGYLFRSVSDNIKNINDSVVTKPIKVIKVNNKYYVNGDGNHKTFYLLFTYYLEKELYKDNEKLLKDLEEKYSINMQVNKVSNYKYINYICYSLIKSNNRDLRFEFKQDNNKIGILYIGNKTIEIKSEQEFISYFTTYLNSLDKNSDKFKLLTNWLLKINYFNEDLTLEESKKR